MIPLGIMAASGAGGGPSMDLLSSTTLTGGAGGIGFTIPAGTASTYQHLQLRIFSRANTNVISSEGFNRLTFNGSASGYTGRITYNGYGSAAGFMETLPTSYAGVGYTLAAFNGGPQFSASVVDILDPFDTTKVTTFQGQNGYWDWYGEMRSAVFGGSWRNTATVTYLEITDGFGYGGLNPGTRVSLYGIKAS